MEETGHKFGYHEHFMNIKQNAGGFYGLTSQWNIFKLTYKY